MGSAHFAMQPFRSLVPMRPEHRNLYDLLWPNDPFFFTFRRGEPNDTPTHLTTGRAYTFAADMDAAIVGPAHLMTEDTATGCVKEMGLASLAEVQENPATMICEVLSITASEVGACYQLVAPIGYQCRT